MNKLQKDVARALAPAGAGTFLGRQAATLIGAAVTVLFFGFGCFVLSRHDDPNDWHYRDFGRLPVIDQGRCKPMDTSARMSLMVLMHRQGFYNPDDKTSYPATKWYLDTATVPMPGNPALGQLFANADRAALEFKIFRIENDQLLRMLNLKMREGLRYSLMEIIPKYDVLMEEAMRLNGDERRGIEPVDPKNYTLIDGKIMELWQHIQIFRRIADHSGHLVIPNPDGSDQWKSFADFMDHFMANGGRVGDDIDARTFETYLKMLALYSGSDPNKNVKERKQEFNSLLTAHLAELEKREPARMKAIDIEIFFSEYEPFFLSLLAYLAIALFTAVSWFTTDSGTPMRKAAYAAMAVVFIVHTLALCTRMYLQGRPPVTNLYSSAIFIGWGCVGMSMIVEAIYKNGIATVVGTVLGFLTLIIAHLLSLDGDTMVMMQAVLDTNFWLATHVTCITLGYTTAFVAGFMGMAYIILGIFTNKLRGEGSANLARMTYGVLCTGMFLSFVGTVLGGLWADYSWGRFWGWDPKENGALLIVIWIALILHARWGGMVKQRGVAVLAVMGIIVTGWSWFGTNFLGVGLHAYGGAKGSAMLGMVLIDFLILGIAVLGMLPLEHWQSFRPLSKAPVPTPGVPTTAIKPAGA